MERYTGVATALNMLEPGSASTNAQSELQYNLYDGLYRHTKDLGLVDWLAQKTDVSSDALTWTLTLRDGVKFHDGSDFDANAVKLNLDSRKAHPRFPFKAQLAPIKEITVVDKRTVQFHLTAPSASLKAVLSGASFGMHSPAAMAQYSQAEYFKHASGTGAFRLDGTPSDTLITMTRNENYWGPKAYLDRIEFHGILDPATEIAALESGDMDVAEVPSADIARVSKEGRFNMIRLAGAQYWLWFNCGKGPFTDKRVRQAVIYGTNRDPYRDVYGRDVTQPGQYLVPSLFFGATQFTEYPYDVAKARQLLRDAGVGDGTHIEFHIHNGDSGQVPVAQLIQRDLEQLGFKVNLVTTDVNAWIAKVNIPASQTIWHLSYSTSSFQYPDAEAYLVRFLYGPNVPPRGGNWLQYQNPQLDRLIDQQAALSNDTERKKALADAQRLVWEDAPMASVLSAAHVAAIASAVHDLDYIVTTAALAPVFQRTWLSR